MGPLAGVKVVEIASLAPAPFGCMMLADLGAEVLRVDRAGAPGDGLTPPDGPLDRGKRSVALDLKDPEDVHALYATGEAGRRVRRGLPSGRRRATRHRPGRSGSRNPRLVYGRMTGWGQDGPAGPASRSRHQLHRARRRARTDRPRG